MKWREHSIGCLLGIFLITMPLTAMEKVASVVEALHKTEEVLDHAREGWLAQWLLTKASHMKEATETWLERGNHDAEVLDAERISSLEQQEREMRLFLEDEDPQVQQQAKRALAELQQERHQREREKYERNKSWYENVNLFKGTMVNLQMKGAGFLMSELERNAALEIMREKLALKAEGEKNARVAVAKEYIQAFIDNPLQLLGFAIVLSLVVPSGIYFAKHGVESLFEYYKLPDLADPDKSTISGGWFSGWYAQEHETSLEDVILHPDIASRIKETVHALKNTVAHGSYLKHILLYGPPGVGKTMVALRIARGSGLDCVYFPASNLVAFSKEEAVKKLRQLLTFAKFSSRPTVIVIDELELLAGDRSNPSMSDKMRALLNLLLAYMSDDQRRFMLIGLTNRKQDLDDAFLSRCDDRIKIDIPGPRELRAILQLYVDKYLVRGENLAKEGPSFWFGAESAIEKPRIESGALSTKELDRIAQQLQGFVGRDIFKLVMQIQSSALASDANVITRELIERVVSTKLNEFETDRQTLAKA